MHACTHTCTYMHVHAHTCTHHANDTLRSAVACGQSLTELEQHVHVCACVAVACGQSLTELEQLVEAEDVLTYLLTYLLT